MSFVTQLAFLQQSTIQSHNALATQHRANQARLGLANNIGFGSSSPASLRNLQKADLALQLRAQQAQVMFAATQAMQQAQQKRLSEYFKQRQEAISNGSLF